ncbi:MAG: sorbosone dehydrogenase family protein, partial [Acidobacteria bacterium]
MSKMHLVRMCTAFTIAIVAATLPAAQSGSHAVLKGPAAFGDWRQDKPGVKRLLRPEDLPPPAPTQSVANFPDTVQMPADAKPLVPSGFSIELVASGLKGPRVIRVAPNGDVFVAETSSHTIRAFRMAPGSAKPSASEVYLSGGLLYQPFGIAFYPPGPNPQWVYIGNSDSLVRVPYKNGDLKAGAKPERIVERIPWVHHSARDVVISADGNRVFYSVGSGSNVALDMFPMPLDQPF